MPRPIRLLPRHGMERIWHASGQTYIIQSSGPSSAWDQTLGVFDQLTTDASVG